MGNYFNPGNEKFDRMIHSEIYVDKTELVRKVFFKISKQQKTLLIILVGINYNKKTKIHECMIEAQRK